MTFIRPELARAAARYREPLTGAAIALPGLWGSLATGGLVRITSVALLAIGIAIVAAGLQRVRFHRDTDGPGVVDVREGQLAYFGPAEGGVAALDDVLALDLLRDGSRQTWRITRAGEPPLLIPADAAGSDRLFDAFTALPGLGPGRLTAALSRQSPEQRVWSRDTTAPRLTSPPVSRH